MTTYRSHFPPPAEQGDPDSFDEEGDADKEVWEKAKRELEAVRRRRANRMELRSHTRHTLRAPVGEICHESRTRSWKAA